MLNSRLSNKCTHLRKHSDGTMITNHLTITLHYNSFTRHEHSDKTTI